MTERCAECGYVYDVAASALPARLAAFGRRYADALDGHDDAALRARPQPDVWSALEYTCHVRDVLLVQRDRLYIALVADDATWPPMYRDARPALARYHEQDPAVALRQLGVAGELAAQAFGVLDAAQLARTFTYNYPAPAEHDLLWLGRHTVHEGEHHLRDVHQVLGAVDG
jgi:DNA segregation ATPase FtsK/SpoIIIE, S-DNA-T family